MSERLLILHPLDPNRGVDTVDGLLQELTNIGLIGKPYERFETTYYPAGSRFLELINFASSHTNLILAETNKGLREVDRVDSRMNSEVRLTDESAEPEFMGAAGTVSPLCPVCACAVGKPYDIIGQWYDDKLAFSCECPCCHRHSSIHELDWQRTAGFARYSLEIGDVWENEATPSQELLGLLGRITGDTWTYFYYRL